MAVTSTYDAVVEHVRREPLDNRFRYMTRMWLVDLDALPTLPSRLRWLGSFESRDHLGSPDRSIRENIEIFLATRGVDLAGGRVIMLANARALGRAVNPISIHWCYASDGRLAAVLAEVHNTYGDRHVYLIEPDALEDTVDAELDKAMYVSPFNPVDGSYRIRVSPPDQRIAVSVTLHRDDHLPFVASLNARRRRPTSTLMSALGAALTSLRVGALIHFQGIKLWRRGLRVEPRPIHDHQETVR